VKRINPFLWFDNQAEEAANFYTSLFANSKILNVARYGGAGPGETGTVMTVSFELDGQQFIALNGGPRFTFTEAISFLVNCETQDEVDEQIENFRRDVEGLAETTQHVLLGVEGIVAVLVADHLAPLSGRPPYHPAGPSPIR